MSLPIWLSILTLLSQSNIKHLWQNNSFLKKLFLFVSFRRVMSTKWWCKILSNYKVLVKSDMFDGYSSIIETYIVHGKGWAALANGPPCCCFSIASVCFWVETISASVLIVAGCKYSTSINFIFYWLYILYILKHPFFEWRNVKRGLFFLISLLTLKAWDGSGTDRSNSKLRFFNWALLDLLNFHNLLCSSLPAQHSLWQADTGHVYCWLIEIWS